MRTRNFGHRRPWFRRDPMLARLACLVIASGLTAASQTPATQQSSNSTLHASSRPAKVSAAAPVTEGELRQQLQGKMLYMRTGYLDNQLHFDEQGHLRGNSPKVSYTLSLVQIDKVRLEKHRLELEGLRYGLHFLGGGGTEDPLQASDKVRITPKKKVLKIVIDRSEAHAAKKKSKPEKPERARKDAPKSAASSADPSLRQPLVAAQSTPPSVESAEETASGTEVAHDHAYADQLLRDAVSQVFAQSIDERMIAGLPDFWRRYYQTGSGKQNYKPDDPSILRQSAVDRKAQLLTKFEPPSNEFAQAAGIVGVALYHVVVAPDGKPAEIAVGRPIGFGLDENAVESIRKAAFQPALKDGKPVPVVLDLLVQFRIFSKGTGVPDAPAPASAQVAQPGSTPLPGPYSAGQPAVKQP